MKKLHVNLGKDSYDIIFEKNLLEKLSDYIKTIYNKKSQKYQL